MADDVVIDRARPGKRPAPPVLDRPAAFAADVVAGLDPVAVANHLRPVLLHINRHLRRELHALGVSSSQVALLSAINSTPGIGVAELAAREGTSAPSISNHIDRLERSGLVTRTRGDTDRRRVGLACTAEGQRVLRAVRSRRTAWLATRLRDLPAGQLVAIEAAIDGLRALVDRP